MNAECVLTDDMIDRLLAAKIFTERTSVDRSRLAAWSILKYEEKSVIEPYAGIYAGDRMPLIMGAFAVTQSPLYPGAIIGRYSSIGSNVKLTGPLCPSEWISSASFTSGAYRGFSNFNAAVREMMPAFKPPAKFEARGAAPVINHDVWIGSNVTLSRDIKIGTGAIVLDGSIVTESVPPYHIVEGNPAVAVALRFDEEIAARMLESRWWRYSFTDLAGLDVTKPGEFLDGLAQRVAEKAIKPFEPATPRLAAILGVGIK